MKLEQQVCSLELARQLKNLGVKQTESLFVWSDHTVRPTLWTDKHLNEDYKDHGNNVYSAFTVAELGEMLPLILAAIGLISMIVMNTKVLGVV